MYKNVGEFTTKILGLPEVAPVLKDANFHIQRYDFMQEELYEYEDAARLGDIVGIADALADLIYVALGTAYQMGLPFEAIWDAVHEANMQKVPGKTKRKIGNDAMKPLGWVGPEAKIFRAIKVREELYATAE